jgi:hypothetical protein
MSWGCTPRLKPPARRLHQNASQGFYESSIPAIQEGKFMLPFPIRQGSSPRRHGPDQEGFRRRDVDRIQTLGMLW